MLWAAKERNALALQHFKPRQSGEREIPTQYANIIVVLITDGKEELAKSFLKKTGFLTETVLIVIPIFLKRCNLLLFVMSLERSIFWEVSSQLVGKPMASDGSCCSVLVTKHLKFTSFNF